MRAATDKWSRRDTLMAAALLRHGFAENGKGSYFYKLPSGHYGAMIGVIRSHYVATGDNFFYWSFELKGHIFKLSFWPDDFNEIKEAVKIVLNIELKDEKQ